MDSRLLTFVEVVTEITGKPIYADESKSPTPLAHLIRNPYFDIRVINLHRDGRAVVNSWVHLQPEISFEAQVDRWKKIEQQRGQVLQRIKRDKVITVQYERLCDTPRDVLHQIFSFLQLDIDISNIKLNFLTGADHHIIGNQMRLGGIEQIQCDEKWKHELSKERVEFFNQVAGHINEANGYQS